MSHATGRRRTLTTITVAILMTATVAFASGGLTAGAADEPLTVDIRVELDYLGDGPSSGPRVFEVTGVDAAAGVWELTEADEIDNPSDWCGSVMVDVDPDTRLVTVATEDSCNFHTARVIITSDEITAVTLVSDDLWGSDIDEGVEMDPVVITHSGDTFELSWQTDPDEDGIGFYLQWEGTAVFAFTLADAEQDPTTTVAEEEPTTTVTGEQPAPTTDPKVAGSAPAATAVTASPSYTG